MKKILAYVCLVAMIFTIAGCAPSAEANSSVGYNRTLVDLVYGYDEAIISRGDGEQRIQVKSWCDYENSDMIQVTATDGTTYLTHSSNLILISNP